MTKVLPRPGWLLWLVSLPGAIWVPGCLSGRVGSLRSVGTKRLLGLGCSRYLSLGQRSWQAWQSKEEHPLASLLVGVLISLLSAGLACCQDFYSKAGGQGVSLLGPPELLG